MTSSDHLATPYHSLEAMLEALPDPAILIALERRKIVAVNTLATAFLDRDTSSLRNAEPSDLRDPQDRVAFSQALEQLSRLAVPPSLTLEESLIGAHGATSLVLSQIRSFEFQGTRHALHVFRPSADDALTSAATLREAVTQLPLPVMLAEPDRPRSIFLNATCAALFGVHTPGDQPVDPSQRPGASATPMANPSECANCPPSACSNAPSPPIPKNCSSYRCPPPNLVSCPS